MKKIYRNLKTAVLALGCMSLLLSSCSDFLDRNPHDFVSPEIFYKNESDCMMALAGVYWTLATDHVYGERYSNILSNTDDLSYYARLNQSGQVYTNSHNSSNNDIYQTWTQLYSGINNANVLLDNIDAANIPDAAVKNRIKGEAKFLRAYYHFLLVQSWYEVPIRTETVTDINNSSLAATPHAEAIDWIIKEMEDCIDLVDDSKYDLSPSHVKKTTVQGILARVCLWRAGSPSNGGKEFYEKAAKYAKAVYDSHKHKLYQGDIYAIWKNIASDKYDTEYNESMWEVEFIGTRVDGKFTYSRIGNTIGNWQENTSATGKGYAYGFYCGSLILWDLFEKNPGDLRRDLSMATYKLNTSDAAVYWKDTEIVTRRSANTAGNGPLLLLKRKTTTRSTIRCCVMPMCCSCWPKPRTKPVKLLLTWPTMQSMRCANVPESIKWRTCHTRNSNRKCATKEPVNSVSKACASTTLSAGEFIMMPLITN